MKIRDSLGWPVSTFAGKPILNFLRYLIHGSIKQTWKLRKRNDNFRPSYGDVQTPIDPEAESIQASIARSVLGRVYQEMGEPSLVVEYDGLATVTFRRKTLLRHSAWLVLPVGLNVHVHPGDTMVLRPLGDGVWECLQYEHNQVITQSYQGHRVMEARVANRTGDKP